MCLFCCDMLCWFSFITCCGCRDMVTRRLVFFPPEPYYDHIEPNEDFNDFYHRLSTKQDDSNDNNNTDETKNSTSDDNDENSDDIVLEIGSKSPKNKILKIKHKHTSPQTNDNDNEREALNTSEENKINKETYGVFRIRDDELNLRDFYWNNYSIRISNFESQYLLTNRGTTIPSYYIRNPVSKYCILFSHGNAADIGLMRNHLCRMYSKCHVSIFAYEYSGYGKSSGKPSEANTYCDIETAYKYCIEILSILPCHIILYGQSLGTGVSVYLASKYPVGGVILHSPLMSGLRVMQHFDKTYWFDIYPVINEIQHVFAPIFVIHGNKDKEIDIQHGKILSRIAPNSYEPWFVPYAGHNDIEVLFPDILFKKIKKFIKYLKNLEKSYNNMKEELDIKQDDNSDDDDDDDDDDILDICDEQTRDYTYKNECDDTYKRLNVNNITKSVQQKITDQSISPPPPQSIMTKSQDRMRQIALPSRKFSNTGGSMIDDEESVLKTPSVGGSLSMKDSNFISISIKDDKSTKGGYDTNVLTPTMRTIHSKEQSTSEMLALPNTCDDSNTNTMSTVHFSNVNKKLNRKSRKNVLNNMSSHPDIHEEKESKIRNKKNRKRGNNKLLRNEQRLNLPQSIHMKDNIKKCFQRRDKLLIQDINDDTSEDSSDDDNVNVNDNNNNNNNNNGINDSDSSVDLQLDHNMNITTNKKKNDK